MNKVLETYLKAERGRLTKLSTALGLTPAAIKQWDIIPAERLPMVSRLTGISMYKLRPGFIETGILEEPPKVKRVKRLEVAQ